MTTTRSDDHLRTSEGADMAQKKAANNETTRPRRASKADSDDAVRATIAAMPERDRAIGERLDAIIRASAPELTAKLWYGQPAYAKDGKVVCFFRGAEVDKERYLTFGFSSVANLDDGHMWPTSYALTALTAEDEARIGALVKQATR
jgi:hypothetical protein